MISQSGTGKSICKRSMQTRSSYLPSSGSRRMFLTGKTKTTAMAAAAAAAFLSSGSWLARTPSSSVVASAASLGPPHVAGATFVSGTGSASASRQRRYGGDMATKILPDDNNLHCRPWNGIIDGYRSSTASMTTQYRPYSSSSTLLQSRRRDRYDDDFDYDYDYDGREKSKKGFLGKFADKAKSLLPTTWFSSEKERKAAIERKKAVDEVSGGIQEALRGAPLPIRMFGKLMSPLLSSAMSAAAEAMAEQQESVRETLEQARSALNNDSAVASALGGGPVSVGQPFSQSTSTASINGRTTNQVQLAFPVQGKSSSGTAQLSAANGSIQRLVLQVNNTGRTIQVDLTARKSASWRRPSSGNVDDDDIIEAEIIEKDTSKR